MNFTTIDTTRVEAIVVITLKREKEMNTLSLELLDEVGRALREAEEDAGVRAIIITGAGRAFCCGAELAYYTTERERIGPDAVAGRKYLLRVLELFTCIETLERPTIAAINGYALGGGAELALACDFRVMAESAKFGFPEAGLGAIPGGGGVQKLHRFVGRGRALELDMLGTHLSAEEAERYGLLYRRASAEQVLAEAIELGRRLSRMSPVALAYAKRAVNIAMDVDIASANLYALDAMTVLASSDDQREGMQAFIEKRPPNVFRA